jgi:hypothetical protein
MIRVEIKIKFLTAIILLVLNGCVTYFPQSVDIPLIKEKGDYRLNAGAFIIPNVNPSEEVKNDLLTDMGLHATFSAGLTDILAVQAYLSFDALLRMYLHGALGLYKGFDNNNVIEMYGGLGYGKYSALHMKEGMMNIYFHLCSLILEKQVWANRIPTLDLD